MKKPLQPPAPVVLPAIRWKETWARLYRLTQDPSPLRPPAPRAVRARPAPARGIPQLKGNVCQTIKVIMNQYLREAARAPRTAEPSVFTSYAALAEQCFNYDPKTAYLHVLTLLEHGFLLAKVRRSRGVTLVLNPDLFVFDDPPAGR